MSRLTELLADLEKEFSQGNRQERELSRADVDTSDLIKNDAALLTGLGTAATLPYTGPKWLANFVTRAATPAVSKMYGAVGEDMSKLFIPPLTKIGQRFRNQDTLPSSGARVGQDARREIIPPLTKIGQRTTNRGPRGPINIETPAVRPKAPPPGTRNTAGVSETDKAMIKMQQAQMNPNKVLIPPLTRTGRRSKEGLMNTSPGKNYMEGVAAKRLLEQQTNRRNFLRQNVMRDQSSIKANEAPSAEYFKNLEELQRLEELLK